MDEVSLYIYYLCNVKYRLPGVALVLQCLSEMLEQEGKSVPIYPQSSSTLKIKCI